MAQIDFYKKYSREFKLNWKLAWPIMLSQIGQVMVNFIDNLMVGKLGGTELAAISLANALFFTFLIFGLGLSFALTPLIAEAKGGNNTKNIKHIFINGLYINLFFAINAALLIYFGAQFIKFLNQPVHVVSLAVDYAKIMGMTMIPFMIFQTYRTLAEGLSETKLIFVVTIIGNVINIIANYGLIFGNFGLPEMGIEGAALGTLIARIAMMVAMIVIFWKWKKVNYYLERIIFVVDKRVIKQLLKLGLPSAFSSTFEVTAFTASAFLIGTFDEVQLASHQIAINLASISFLMVSGFATAATIRVSNKLGQKNKQGMIDTGNSIFVQVSMFMFVFALLFILFRHHLPKLYIDDPEIIKTSATLLLVASIFQIVDGLQVAGMGILRGMQDVLMPSLITFVAYWIFALPFGYFMANIYGFKALGIWIGLATGLTLAAVMLTMRFHHLSKSKKLKNYEFS